jgi:predicted metalloprotease with PDZ domain
MKHTAVTAAVLGTLLGLLAQPSLAEVPPLQDIPYPGTLALHVDATDLTHRIFRVHEDVPVQAGPLTLLYPAWIPGHHSQSGPIDKVAGIRISAEGRAIPWERDQDNIYAFHLTVPEGVNRIGVDFDFLSPQNREQGRVLMTPEMLNLEWNTVALYPAGTYDR